MADIGDEIDFAVELYSDDYNYTSISYFDWIMTEDSRKKEAISMFSLVLLFIPLGLVLNALLIYAIVVYQHIRRRIHYVLVANLAVADILFLVFEGIDNLVYEGCYAFNSFPNCWHILFVKTWEQFTVYYVLETISILALSTTVAFLAIDQYLVIVHPTVAEKWRNRKSALKVCGTIWIASVAIGLINALVYWHGPFYEQIWMVHNILDAVLCYVFPLVVIIFCYVSINRVTRQMRCAQDACYADAPDASLPPYRDYARQKRLFALNTSVTIAFLIGHGIYHVGIAVLLIAWKTLEPDHAFYLNNHDIILGRVLQITLFVNAALNPVFYISTNRRLRKHVLDVVRSYRTAEATAAHHLGESTSTVTSPPVEPVNLWPFQPGSAAVEDATNDCQSMANK